VFYWIGSLRNINFLYSNPVNSLHIIRFWPWHDTMAYVLKAWSPALLLFRKHGSFKHWFQWEEIWSLEVHS
jgi:hypothetical protein